MTKQHLQVQSWGMVGAGQLRRVGNGLLVGGLVMAFGALAILVINETVTHGGELVAAAAILFLVVGGIGATLGLVFRIVAAALQRSRSTPVSPRWRPPPRGRF